MYTTSDFRRGLRVEIDGQPYQITEFEHHKPGKGAAIVRTKMRNLLTGQTSDPTFRSGDKVGRPDIEDTKMQFLYADGETYHFMDPNSYEQLEMNKDALGEQTYFLIDGMTVDVVLYKERPISIDLPNHVVLEVVECDPAVKGDTVTGASKPAKLQTGLSVNVPLFINEGDKLRIDTRTSSYIERA